MADADRSKDPTTLFLHGGAFCPHTRQKITESKLLVVPMEYGALFSPAKVVGVVSSFKPMP